MNDITVTDNLTLRDIAIAPDSFPEEVVGAGLDVIKNLETQLREYKQNMTANMIRRMNEENATKLIFIGIDGKEKVLTVKKGSMKLNPSIKDYEDYIKKSGFAPSMLGALKFVPFGWKEMKEKRKQGGNMQLLCDELYKEGQPSIVIEEK